MIRQVGNRWCIFSHRTGKRLSCYDTKEEAEQALARMGRFKTFINKKKQIYEVPNK